MIKPAQEKSIVALISGKSVNAAAKAANVDKSTLYRWMLDSEYNLEYTNARSQVYRDNTQSLMKGIDKATKTLTDIMANCDNDNTRLQAAKTLLDTATNVYQAVNQDTQMAALKAQIEQLEGGKNE
ncbi:hypothetical protein [Lentilactobacillus kefiri]|uniref:hypothetical protein n=1 Tax=Lentilactobacillus kefiri TaxID=33962 RepID=UPI001FBBC3A3|nr:hypothetical protein [Lentilactobacillus kefiri]MCJ2162748.1 hypothetical protein [Lentilactobacillus kefiri]MCP9370150.1 hypothetical protein [Lentilactobacillus kefiri]